MRTPLLTWLCLLMFVAASQAQRERRDPELLEAENKLLQAEVTRLSLQLLKALDRLLRVEPHDRGVQLDAAVLASQLAPKSPGNRLVWRVLLATGTLRDGVSLAEAERLLGPPTTRSDKQVEWYFNPESALHVAPYLRARITDAGLTEWKEGRR